MRIKTENFFGNTYQCKLWVKAKDDGPQVLPAELTWDQHLRPWPDSAFMHPNQQLCTSAFTGLEEKSHHIYALPCEQKGVFKDTASESECKIHVMFSSLFCPHPHMKGAASSLPVLQNQESISIYREDRTAFVCFLRGKIQFKPVQISRSLSCSFSAHIHPTFLSRKYF